MLSPNNTKRQKSQVNASAHSPTKLKLKIKSLQQTIHAMNHPPNSSLNNAYGKNSKQIRQDAKITYNQSQTEAGNISLSKTIRISKKRRVSHSKNKNSSVQTKRRGNMVHHHSVVNVSIGQKMDLLFYKAELRKLRQSIVILQLQKRKRQAKIHLSGKLLNTSQIKDELFDTIPPNNGYKHKKINSNNSFRVNKFLNDPQKNNLKHQKQQIQAEQKKTGSRLLLQFQQNLKKQIEQPIEKNIQKIVKQYDIRQYQMPNLPFQPKYSDDQEDLQHMSKLTFMAFHVPLKDIKQIQVKKYRNCIFFKIQEYHVLWYFDGRFYFGGWQGSYQTGCKNGNGVDFIPNKFLYKGQFSKGKRNGLGFEKKISQNISGLNLVCKSSKKSQKGFSLYEGQWVDGEKWGKGKYLDQYGIFYEGQWQHNTKHGYGQLKLPNNDFYRGNFHKGLKTGKGEQFFNNGDSYLGQYLQNQFSGKGTYKWSNGSEYQGDFSRGLRSGEGIWKSQKSQEGLFDVYVGQYDLGKKNGFGRYKWSNGITYEGFFKDDKKHGQGMIKTKDGKRKYFIWQNDKKIREVKQFQNQST